MNWPSKVTPLVFFSLAILVACRDQKVQPPATSAPGSTTTPALPTAEPETAPASKIAPPDAPAPKAPSLDAGIQTPEARDAARREALKKFQQSRNENPDRR